ncbi:MAG: retention module-containing protein, partial [Pseudomonas sp.]
MSTVTVTVKTISGQVFAGTTGNMRMLVEGDQLLPGEEIITGPDGSVTFSLSNGETVTLGNLASWKAPAEEATAAGTEAPSAIEAALAAGMDPTAALEATAAGTEAPTETAGQAGTTAIGGGSRSIVMLDATGTSVEASVGYETTGLTTDNTLTQPIQTTVEPAPAPAAATTQSVGFTSQTTNDVTPRLQGTVSDPNAVVTVTIGGTDYTAINNGNGTWTLPDNTVAALVEGGNTATVTATSPDGSTVTATGVVTVDTTAPQVTINSQTTTDTTPALTGTVDDPTATVVVTVNGVDYPAINNGDGTWTLADNSVAALVVGATPVTVTATDAVGNSGTNSGNVTIENAPTTLTVSINDQLTNDNTPELTGTVSDNTAIVVVTVNGVDYTAVNNGDGTWTLPDNTLTALPDGLTNVTVTATLPDTGRSATDTGTITVDTVAPNDGDNKNSITFNDGGDELVNASEATSVTLSGKVEVGNTVTGVVITDANGTTQTVDLADVSVAADGTVTIAGQDLSGLAQGQLTVTMSVRDVAGNAGTVTDTTTLDTIAPATGDNKNSITFNDGGDELVNASEATSVTLSGKVEVGNTVTGVVITDANGTTQTVDLADVSIAADGTVTIAGQDLSQLAQGQLTVTMSVRDVAGNAGTVTDTTTLDTVAPATGDNKNSIAFNDGGDELVNASEATSVTLSGKVEVGNTVTGVVITDANGTTQPVDLADVSVAADGTVTIAGQDLSQLAQGQLTVTMSVRDVAGNAGSVTDTTTLDTVAPATGDNQNSIAFNDGGDELVNANEATSVPLSGKVEVGNTVTGVVITDANGTTQTVDLADVSVAADGTVT